MNPHFDLEWERFIAFVNVMTFGTLATVNRVKAGSEPLVDRGGVLMPGECRWSEKELRS